MLNVRLHARAQGFLRVVSTTNGGQERKFDGGSMQLSDRLAAALPPGTVRLTTPVVRVDQRSGDGVTVTAAGGGGGGDRRSIYAAQYVISAVPLPLLNRVEFQPPLSARKLQLIQSMPMGSCVKTMTYYDKPYWRRAGMCGAASDTGVTVWCIDDTKPDGFAPCIVGFVNGAYVSYHNYRCYYHTHSYQVWLSRKVDHDGMDLLNVTKVPIG